MTSISSIDEQSTAEIQTTSFALTFLFERTKLAKEQISFCSKVLLKVIKSVHLMKNNICWLPGNSSNWGGYTCRVHLHKCYVERSPESGQSPDVLVTRIFNIAKDSLRHALRVDSCQADTWQALNSESERRVADFRGTRLFGPRKAFHHAENIKLTMAIHNFCEAQWKPRTFDTTTRVVAVCSKKKGKMIFGRFFEQYLTINRTTNKRPCTMK